MDAPHPAREATQVPHTLNYTRRRPRPLHIGVGLLVLFFAAFAAWSIVSGRYVEMPKGPRIPQFNDFYGLVIDQDGNPLEDVEVKVMISELDKNLIMPGGNVTVQATQKSFSVWAGQGGRFMVTLPEGYQQLEIVDLVKSDYDWVKDWAWGLDVKGANTYYFFEGKRPVPPYESDPNNPAIFPMHEIGNPSPPTRPSRGGSDNGKRNEPTDLVIPSAGPGAPRGPDEVRQRLDERISAKREEAGKNLQPKGAGPVTLRDLARIKIGMNEAQVRRVAGGPDNILMDDPIDGRFIYYIQIGRSREPNVERYDVIFKRDGDKLVVSEVRGPIGNRR